MLLLPTPAIHALAWYRRRVIAHNQLSELELGLVANLSIETADEARKLVPTLDVSCRWAAQFAIAAVPRPA